MFKFEETSVLGASFQVIYYLPAFLCTRALEGVRRGASEPLELELWAAVSLCLSAVRSLRPYALYYSCLYKACSHVLRVILGITTVLISIVYTVSRVSLETKTPVMKI